MSSTSQRRLVISQTVASNFCFYTKLVKNLLRGESRFEKYVFRCRLPDQLFSDFFSKISDQDDVRSRKYVSFAIKRRNVALVPALFRPPSRLFCGEESICFDLISNQPYKSKNKYLSSYEYLTNSYLITSKLVLGNSQLLTQLLCLPSQ